MLEIKEGGNDDTSNYKISEQEIALVKKMKTGGAKRALASVHCPVELAIRIIGGKWKPVIIWHLRDSKKRFGELKREIKGITVKMLAQQLRELEQDGLVDRKMFYEVPPRVEYSLTDLGRSLEPALRELGAWGKKYRSKLIDYANRRATEVSAEERSSATIEIPTVEQSALEAAGK